MIYTYQHNGVTYTVDLEALSDGNYRAIIDDHVYAVRAVPLGNGSSHLTFDNQHLVAYTAAAGKNRYVKVGSETVQTLAVPDTRTSRRRTGSASASAQLLAQMPGQVVEVYVSEGESVSSGQTLLVLEAMKMEIRISAPNDGIVRQVRVKTGDVVERDQLLLEVSSVDGSAASSEPE